MAALHDRLSRELARVLSCPYPASLKRLNDILVDADDGDGPLAVTAWVNEHPCQVTELCEVAANALPLWPYSLHILQCLCRAPAFRSCLLRCEPGILDDLLNKANSSLHGFNEYFQICVLFLSESLPESLPLPAAAQSFFLHAFEKAAQAPCVNTLAPIYAMLIGACHDLMDVLPQSTRDAFDQQICHILASNSAKQDPMLLLTCIGISVLAEGIPITSELHDAAATPLNGLSHERRETRWSTPAARRLFGSAKAMTKTTTMTVLSVIWACKGGVGVTDAEAAQGIKIAIRVLQSVDLNIRYAWLHSSSLTKSMLPKLVEKGAREGIHPLVQLEAFGFLGTLLGKDDLPPQVVAQYNKNLDHFLHQPFAAAQLIQSLSISIPVFAYQFDDNTSNRLLRGLLRATRLDTSLERREVYCALSSQLTTAIPVCVALRKSFLFSLSSSNLQEDLSDLLDWTSPSNISGHESGDICSNTAADSRRRSVSSLLTLIFTAALTAQVDEPGLPANLVPALLEIQNRVMLPSTTCPQNIPIARGRAKFSVFEQSCTPRCVPSQSSWKDRLAHDLEQQNVHQRAALIRTVTQICHELEERCANVEEPLREEQRKVEGLQNQVTLLEGMVSTLESEATDRKLLVDGLEEERMQWELDLRHAESRNDGLSKSLEDLKQKLEENRRQAREAKQSHDVQEIQMRANALSSEENLQQRTGQIERLEVKTRDLQADLNNQKADSERVRQLYDGLAIELQGVQRDLHHARRENSQKANQIADLVSKKGELTDDLEYSKQERADTAYALLDLRRVYADLEDSSKNRMTSMELKYEADLRNAMAQAGEEANRLSRLIEDAGVKFDELKQTYEGVLHEIDLDKATISELETENDQLRESCASKDEELDVLNALKKRVLSSIGVDSASPIRPVRSHKDPSKTRFRQKPETRHGITMQPHVRHGGTELVNGSKKSRDERSPTSPKLSPAMKRTKAGGASNAAPIKPCRPSTGIRASKSLSSSGKELVSQRWPLANVSARANQSPSRRRTIMSFEIAESPGKGRLGEVVNQEDALESVSFPSGIFTSTPLTPRRRFSDFAMLESRQVVSGETTVEY